MFPTEGSRRCSWPNSFERTTNVSTEVEELRRIVQESIRVQRGGSRTIEYVDVTRALADMTAKQNHVIFGRRGCGKTLLMQAAQKKVDQSVRVVYINCEDYKQHSFPNVLIEILDALFHELERNLSGWFGRKKRSRQLIGEIRQDLGRLKERADETDSTIRQTDEAETAAAAKVTLGTEGAEIGANAASKRKAAREQEYKQHDSKIQKLNLLLPQLKGRIREFFEISAEVKSVFLELDDFYHLPRTMQPHVADYVHRLCKDVPLYFKFATLRHASMLFADRGNQPTGAQERHDYQPINVDFTLADFKKTADQLRANREFRGRPFLFAVVFTECILCSADTQVEADSPFQNSLAN
jgi:AAA domain